MLKDRAFYFSDPKHFNDPVDCKIGIYSALKAAVDLAQKEDETIKSKLGEIAALDKILRKIENDVKKSAVFSLSKEENNMLMWSHYADSHKGFAVGFKLSTNFTKYNEANAIIGTEEVHYSTSNPFVDYFIELAKCKKPPTWDEFWVPLISMGLVAKSSAWKYENEVRIIRGIPGKVKYSHEELREVIFGLNMAPNKKNKIKKILSSTEWSHVQTKEVIREDDGFKLKVVVC